MNLLLKTTRLFFAAQGDINWVAIGNTADALLQAKEIIEENCPHILTADERGIAIELAIAAMNMGEAQGVVTPTTDSVEAHGAKGAPTPSPAKLSIAAECMNLNMGDAFTRKDEESGASVAGVGPKGTPHPSCEISVVDIVNADDLKRIREIIASRFVTKLRGYEADHNAEVYATWAVDDILARFKITRIEGGSVK